MDAQAHGTGSEAELLLPVVAAIQGARRAHTLLTADAGYHGEANLAALAAQQIPALIAGQHMRKRDPRFANQGQHQRASYPLHNKTHGGRATAGFAPSAFTHDASARTGLCPAGKSLYRKGHARIVNGYVTEQFRGAKRDCVPRTLYAMSAVLGTR